jgi:hypothetical protein
MFALAYLQDPGNGTLRIEERMLRSEFERRGIAVELYTLKKIQRRALPLTREVFIAGDMDAMHGAMKQLGIDLPAPDDYPDSLMPFMHRRVWKETLGDVWHRLASEGGPAVFAKPASRRKAFTGRVFASTDDFAFIGGASRRQDVWCSNVVAWRSEFRVYVIDAGIVGVDHYAGAADVPLDLDVVQAALRAYAASGRAPSAYGIDFGVLANGQTALVEANDGYALGAYAIDARPYTDLLMRRWRELLDTARA